MSSSNLNIRIDDNLRAEVSQILAGYGLSPAQAVKLFFNQVAATRKVPLSFDFQAESDYALTPKAQMRLRQSVREFANGEVDRFDGLDELNQAIAEISRD